MSTQTQDAGAATTTRFQAQLMASMGDQIRRLGWDAGTIAAHQRDRLRLLLRHAQQHSRFHAERLAGVNAERFELSDLASLPVMTKADLMSRFDDVATDARITREGVEAHIAHADETPRWFAGDYMCLASGGSSGTRGVFALSFDALVAMAAANLRPRIALALADGEPPPGGMVVGIICAPAAIHATRVISALIDGVAARFVSAPSTLPLDAIVARLNEGQPTSLIGYPSVLRPLAAEKAAGRLTIAPSTISSTSEQLAPEVAAEIEAAFGVPVVNTFGSSEGLMGSSEPGDDAIVFASDQVIVELVDEHHRPVAAGTPSHSVLITNLENLAQPLIRYELNDSFVQHPPAPHHGHLRASVYGRTDEAFVYGDVRIHPLVFRSALVKAPEVVEYRVHQTPRGADLDIVVSGAGDEAALAARISRGLAAAGLAEPRVRVRTVERIERNGETGKLRRFIPLRPARA